MNREQYLQARAQINAVVVSRRLLHDWPPAIMAQAVDELREALAVYGHHDIDCPHALISGGRPSDRGYELHVGGQWYPREDLPKCTCGLNDLLEKYKEGA
jgi:hypothetical protein